MARALSRPGRRRGLADPRAFRPARNGPNHRDSTGTRCAQRPGKVPMSHKWSRRRKGGSGSRDGLWDTPLGADPVRSTAWIVPPIPEPSPAADTVAPAPAPEPTVAAAPPPPLPSRVPADGGRGAAGRARRPVDRRVAGLRDQARRRGGPEGRRARRRARGRGRAAPPRAHRRRRCGRSLRQQAAVVAVAMDRQATRSWSGSRSGSAPSRPRARAPSPSLTRPPRRGA